MKPNELMIGDWVYKPKYNGDVLIYTAETVEADDLYLGRISDFKEIPLTPEILEKKFGFVCEGTYCWALKDDFTGDTVLVLWKVANGFALDTAEGMTIGIQSVNELQHRFRLCGMAEIQL